MIENDYYSEETHGPHEYFELGDFPLIQGATLQNAKLAYKVFGALNERKDNAILFPHMWSGTPKAMEIFLGEGRPLDPSKYFIILPGQFGNGFSSSPTNTPKPHDMGAFPQIMIGDDVCAQYRLVTEKYGLTELQLVLGWSMGAQQTYEWAVRYPDFVKRAMPIAGTSKTTPHNQLFVQLIESAITSDPAWNNGFYTEPHAVEAGLRRHAEVWSVMGLCPGFYKQEAWRELGFSSTEDFIRGFWEAYFLPMDPNNLICMARKWRHGDVSMHDDGNLAAALKRIKAKTIVVAFGNDMFFPPEDCRSEAELICHSEYAVIDSLWAHFAMFCLSEKDRIEIDKQIRNLLAD